MEIHHAFDGVVKVRLHVSIQARGGVIDEAIEALQVFVFVKYSGEGIFRRASNGAGLLDVAYPIALVVSVDSSSEVSEAGALGAEEGSRDGELA